MAFLDAAKSLKAAAMTDTTVHNLTVTRLDVGHDHGPVSCGLEAPPGRHGRHMAGGASSCSAARHRQAKPRGSHQEVVYQQRSAASCRTRSADCGQAVLCASGSGGEWERCLFGRCGSAEQHGEHRQDGAEARKPWQPSLAAAGAHTPTSPMDGRCSASSGPLSRPRAAAPELADCAPSN